MYHRRIALLKFLFEKGSIKSTEIDKFLSSSVGIGVEIEGKVKDSVETLQPHIPQDLHMWAESVRNDARELLGVGRPQAGASERSSRRTAREIDVTQMGFDTRLDERRDRIADALTTTMRKVNQIIFTFWKAPRVVQDGAIYWVQFTAEAVRVEYNLQVDIESMTPTTKAMRRRDLVQLVQSLAKYPGANLDYLIRSLLSEFPYIDAMKVLPQAPESMGGQAMPMDKFAQTQQRLLTDQGFREARVARTTGQLQAGGVGV